MSSHRRHESWPILSSNRPIIRRMIDRISSADFEIISRTEPPSPSRAASKNDTDLASEVMSEPGSTQQLLSVDQPECALSVTDLCLQDDGDDNLSPYQSRVPISQSILDAYAAMHGRNDDNGGPLWSSLFMIDDPNFQDLIPEEWTIPPVLRRRNSSEVEANNVVKLPQGKLLFYDLAKSPTKLLRHSKRQSFNEAEVKARARHLKHWSSSRNLQTLYEQGQSPPKFKPNHYKGEEAFANYGYVSIHGTWVDPDDQGEVADALMGYSESATPSLPTSTSTGPLILSQEEEEEEYSKFIDYVSDDEGDPRQYRIDPEIFSNWAVNCRRESQYVKEEVKPQPRRRRKRHNNPVPKTPPRTPSIVPQFDVRTGSPLSGYYEVDQDPSPLYSPQGVDIFKRPGTKFTLCNPQANLDIFRAAYGPHESVEAQPPSPPANSAFLYTVSSDKAERALAINDDAQSGVDRLRHYKQHVNIAHLTRAKKMDMYLQKMQGLNQMLEEKRDLEKDVFFLRHRVELLTQYAKHTKRAKEAEEKLQRHLHQRQLREGSERLTQDINWAQDMVQRLDIETQIQKSEIGDLEQEKARLLAKMGVRQMDQLPDVVPQGKLP